MYCNKFQFTSQKAYSRQSQIPHLTWKNLTLMNRNWTGKLQVTQPFGYISGKKISLAHFQSLLERNNRDAFLENEGKIHEGGYVK